MHRASSYTHAILLLLALAGGCSHQVAETPATDLDAWNYYHAQRLTLVDGATTQSQIRDTMGVAPSGTFKGDQIWFYLWGVKPEWQSFQFGHEDATDESDRVQYTEYLFLEFDDAGVLRQHALTNDRYEHDPFNNPITQSINADERRAFAHDYQAKAVNSPFPAHGNWQREQ